MRGALADVVDDDEEEEEEEEEQEMEEQEQEEQEEEEDAEDSTKPSSTIRTKRITSRNILRTTNYQYHAERKLTTKCEERRSTPECS
eukprot:1589119-Amphidinium_carterae.1